MNNGIARWTKIAALSVAVSFLVAVSIQGTAPAVPRPPVEEPLSFVSPNTSTEQGPPLALFAWSEDEIHVVLSPGETIEREVTISTATSTNNVTLLPTGPASQFLTVEPDNLRARGRNQEEMVALQFSVPAQTPLGTYEGVVEVRRGFATFQRPLEVTLNVWQSVVGSSVGASLKLPADWTARVTDTRLRLQNYAPHDSRAILPDEALLEVFAFVAAGEPNWPTYITDVTTVILPSGHEGFRGVRASPEFSTSPGYDLYVPINDKVYLLLGTYDGISASTLNTIKAIQATFEPRP